MLLKLILDACELLVPRFEGISPLLEQQLMKLVPGVKLLDCYVLDYAVLGDFTGMEEMDHFIPVQTDRIKIGASARRNWTLNDLV